MPDDKYDGWTNRETWAAHLWITNDAELYRAYRGSSASDLESDFRIYADRALLGDVAAIAMLLSIGSLWRVNWDELSEALK